MEKYSRSEYDKMEKLIPSQVKQVRQKFAEKYNIVIPEDRDKFIARCLRLKDGNVENAIAIIDSYHTTILNLPRWNVDLSPSVGRAIPEVALAIRNADSNGRRILILRSQFWDPDKMDFVTLVAQFWMITQYAQAIISELQTLGMVTIFDWDKFSLKQGLAVNKAKLLTLMKWAQNGVLGRVAEVHCINHPKIVSLFYKAMKPFLKDKLKKRIILHDSLDGLVKHMGAQCLPTFYGGSLDPETCIDEDLKERFFSAEEYFKDMFQVGFPSM